MIFIGIFGIQDKIKFIKEFMNYNCYCGDASSIELFKKYRYFHIFFIPVYKWGFEYFAQTKCCRDVIKLKKDFKDVFETHSTFESEWLDLSEIPNKKYKSGVCLQCKEHILPSFVYCPYCGTQIK